MSKILGVMAGNRAFVDAFPGAVDGLPSRGLAVLTCMDTRIDVLPALGLAVGEAHVLRNAGARVTNDMLRSLALSSHVLGVDTLVVMQHTRCGLAGVTDDELREATGADIDFLAIEDQAATVRADVELAAGVHYLGRIKTLAGMIYDVDTGRVDEVARIERIERSA